MKAIPLVELGLALHAKGVRVPYRKIYQLACDGELPGAHRVRGRWHFAGSIEKAAEAVGEVV